VLNIIKTSTPYFLRKKTMLQYAASGDVIVLYRGITAVMLCRYSENSEVAVLVTYGSMQSFL